MAEITRPAKEWLPLREAVSLLEKRGIHVTTVQIRNAGLKYDFARRVKNHYHYEYHRLRMYEYFCTNDLLPEKGEVKISDIARQTGYNFQMVCYILNKSGVLFHKVGRGQGINYVNENRSIEAVEKYRKDNHGKKEE